LIAKSMSSQMERHLSPCQSPGTAAEHVLARAVITRPVPGPDTPAGSASCRSRPVFPLGQAARAALATAPPFLTTSGAAKGCGLTPKGGLLRGVHHLGLAGARWAEEISTRRSGQVRPTDRPTAARRRAGRRVEALPSRRSTRRCSASCTQQAAGSSRAGARARALRVPQSWRLGGSPEQCQEDPVHAVPVRPELRVQPVTTRAAQAWHLREQRGRVEHLHIVSRRQHGGHDAASLGEVRGAGDVRDHAVRPGRIERRGQQPSLQRASGRRRSAPSPEHGTSAGTRSNAPCGQAGMVPSATMTPRPAGAGRSGTDQPGPVQRTSAASTRASRPAASPASSRAVPLLVGDCL
jgi:hypothetical protein